MLSAWQKLVNQSLRSDPLVTLVHLGLRGFSIPYWFGVSLKNRLYNQGYLTGEWLPARVVSVGNLSVGGTGKTPLTIALARYYKSNGISLAILSRGYGAICRQDVAIVSDGRKIFYTPSEVGDEPFLMGRNTGVPVLVGRKRWQSGLEAIKRFGARVLILDDGFQHRRLARDVDVVLLDSRRSIQNEWVLPAGVWRENLGSLGRANVLVLTGYNQNLVCRQNEQFLKRHFPQIPIFRAAYRPESVLVGSAELPPSELVGKKVVAFSGLAANEHFLDTVKSLGVEVTCFVRFDDHHVYKRKDVERLISLKLRAGADILLTTEKDGVKLESLYDDNFRPWILQVRLQILQQEADFFRFIRDETY
jgi:tetraacyldisaccharide 4'-kinase